MVATRHTRESRIAGAAVRPAATPLSPLKRRLRLLKHLLIIAMLAAAAVGFLFVRDELRTAELQSRELSRFASTLHFELQPDASATITYPQHGPFDQRLGYARLPEFLPRLERQGFDITQQVTFSEPLQKYVKQGFYPPYQEKDQAGLSLFDSGHEALFDYAYPQGSYTRFDAIPDLVVQTLLFLENRDLLNPDARLANPAVDWSRFGLAAVSQVSSVLGFDMQPFGGSTLATQLEKYRHSPNGQTENFHEKIRQMVSASVRSYQQGTETLAWRQRIVLDYLNTVPLAAAPGFGEIHGLAGGLRVWFDADFARVNDLLAQPASAPATRPGMSPEAISENMPENMAETTPETTAERAVALRQVLALLLAQRRPSYYLTQGHAELAQLTDSHIRLLARAELIDSDLRDAALASETRFRDFNQQPVTPMSDNSKAVTVVRSHLASLLNISLYELDRLDMVATSTVAGGLQREINHYLTQLADAEFAAQQDLIGTDLLTAEQTPQVTYSFTLFERSQEGNKVRVQTDNSNQAFDLNEGSKLELGSTAKLRVLVHYLDVMAELHNRLTDLPAEALQAMDIADDDVLTHWARNYLLSQPQSDLATMLAAAMERRYSANPNERFFTGGGVHRFVNFRRADNTRFPTVREAMLESINLPFVRMMRDLVRYSIYQSPVNATELLRDQQHPAREEYLRRFADAEGTQYLRRFWRKYEHSTPEQAFELFLKGVRHTPVRLAAIHRYVYPNARLEEFDAFMRGQAFDKPPSKRDIGELYISFAPGAFSLNDQGYIAKVHPLELWLLQHKLENPAAKFNAAVAASEAQRQEVYQWLFKTRYKLGQDTRIRTLLEADAFLDVHQRWQRFGYPFESLVPSLATALGTSGDRPAALAELMGIIMNDGEYLPTRHIEAIHFAQATPYETRLERLPAEPVRVTPKAVAEVARQVLAEVVESGSGWRLQDTYMAANGEPLRVGGKTGTGDNRSVQSDPDGQEITSQARNRTAAFVFFLGEDLFGTLTAYVPGSDAEAFSFTSALPVRVLKGMAPILQGYIDGPVDLMEMERVVSSVD